MQFTDPDARKLIVHAAWAWAEVAKFSDSRSKAAAIAKAKFDGIAEAADVLGLAMTPFAFLMAVKEAFEEVGRLERSIAGSAEKSRAARDAWTGSMYNAVATRLT